MQTTYRTNGTYNEQISIRRIFKQSGYQNWFSLERTWKDILFPILINIDRMRFSRENIIILIQISEANSIF